MTTKHIIYSWLAISGLFFAARGVACPCEDKQIVSILLNTDQAAITISSGVLNRLQNAELVEFAKSDIVHHQTNSEALTHFSIDTGTPPEPSDLSRAVITRANEQIAKLAATKTSEIDRAYIAARVDELQLELTALKTYWIPKAQKPELKVFLAKLRPIVAADLEKAQILQRVLEK